MKPSIFSRTAAGAAGILVVLVVWHIMADRYPALILPSPIETLAALRGLWQAGLLWPNCLITLQRSLAGFGLAFAAGFVLALAAKANGFCRNLLRPLCTTAQIIPPVVWIILAMIWFGVARNATVVFLIFIVTFPVVFINLFSGLSSIDTRLVEMARVYRFPPAQRIIHVYLQAILPYLLSAASIGIAFAWKSAVFAEFIGSSSGVGFALSMAYSNLETEKVFAWTLVLIAVMLIFEYGILGTARKRAVRWMQHE